MYQTRTQEIEACIQSRTLCAVLPTYRHTNVIVDSATPGTRSMKPITQTQDAGALEIRLLTSAPKAGRYAHMMCGMHIYERVFSALTTVSFYTQLRLMLFIYWSSPVLF
jgi:hypothetical protein